MMQVKLSTSYYAKVSRIKRLPEIVDLVVDGATKKHLLGIVNAFKNGIKREEFNLIALASVTVDQKERLDYSQPETPLYGKGDDEPSRSYINMLRIRKLKSGKWKLFPSWAKHHKANVKLKDLMQIHEYGATIKTKNGDLIRIPPRPAFALAYMSYMTDLKKREITKEVKKAITDYINEGKSSVIDIYNQVNNETKGIEE